MKNICLNFFLLILSYSSFAQQTFEGTIINKQTKMPISYITVKLIKEGIATSADETGSFKLISIHTQINDTLQFTGIGYLPVKISIKNYHKEIIEMTEDAIYLNEISISKKKKRVERENMHVFSFSDFGLTETRFSYYKQVAKRFDCRKENGMLEKVRIGRVVDAANRNTYTRFRLHIYGIDPGTGAPSEDLTHELIEIEDNNNTYIDVNLAKYSIIIPKKSFFIAVEWLYIPINECYTHLVHSKYDINLNFIKSRALYITNYQPLLYHVPFERNIKQPYTWVMEMNGKWLNFYHSDISRPVGEAAISAQIIY